MFYELLYVKWKKISVWNIEKLEKYYEVNYIDKVYEVYWSF